MRLFIDSTKSKVDVFIPITENRYNGVVLSVVVDTDL